MAVGVLVVTGGSRGIGAAVGRLAARAGWSVCLSYRAEQAAAEALAEELCDLGAPARAVRADMSVEADIVGLFAAAAELGPVAGTVHGNGAAQSSAVAEQAGMAAVAFRENLESRTLKAA